MTMSDVSEVNSALKMPPLNPLKVKGAEAALWMKIILADFKGEWDADDFITQYRSHEWDFDLKKAVEVEPHFLSFANCSDFFWWGSADAETITMGNMHLLREAVEELNPYYKAAYEQDRENGRLRQEELSDGYKAWEKSGNETPWSKTPEFKAINDKYPYIAMKYEYCLPLLFAAKSRKMRPQGAYYKSIPENIWHLFDACGPEREVGMGNPRKPGE
ncbi:hypothetical protein QEH42_gp234 [Microbacterium phage Pumpernickel]|uniref:Uncharacterized protein n=1 Tax=Microbacterium phage Pumpernickel TaxID=2885983 RepID=A0AAE8Y789_9CAUD|nr:hypothetical protein QEH42_gp234 [Microbacterium phage Pumpernickel]UDL15984.1 hypothetical protein SEA_PUMPERNICKEL_234 [Microbacterium phage Pumpernickel]